MVILPNKLCFATNNQGKIEEVRALVDEKYQLIGLNDIGFLEELPEPFQTLEENSAAKALKIYNSYSINCFADDSGLEVISLNGAPGVFSARYAGEQKNDSDNIELLLKNLENKANRTAKFRTVITLIWEEKKIQFIGQIDGLITTEKRGTKGFGYDSVFMPTGFNKTFAEMDLIEKNAISHRAIAINKLVSYLQAIL